MGSLGNDTALDDHEGGYRATLSRDWEIWGPNGGYIATIALRAAGRASRFSRPANVAVHFLGVASFDAPVDCEVEVVKATRRAESIRVVMRQSDRLIAQLICWAIGDDQLDKRHDALPLATPRPEELPTVTERLAAAGIEPDDDDGRHRFWQNFEECPVSWVDDWENRGVLDPEWSSWMRFISDPVTDDPWLEAGRILLLADLGGWPAAHRAHPPEHDAEWFAPSLDVSCHFNDLGTTEWLLTEHHSPVARDGLIGATSRVWSHDGRLLASGVTQLLATPTRG